MAVDVFTPAPPVLAPRAPSGDALLLVDLARALVQLDDLQDTLIALAVHANQRQQAAEVWSKLNEEILHG